ncbi:MAG TPA: DNA recombination protein RmuC [Humidesulfovibrio sp.]|uniref:DNA recombination protein RmuC n=1 Tax=Humidesulfovibrio sp. TaxID=2910988 RepID=UPI002C475360|nr:DNA recombination protein RmuC [Humidesulfovibrio sp.]HWR03549.1 DNA recombination protein RmuC [Humidesulfovibrio sp.]
MDMLSGGLALALALAVGLALGAALAALLLKSRSAGMDERLRGTEAQAAQLRADLDAARSAGLKAVEALRAETARRAGAEEAAARVPGLEDRLAGLAAEVSALRVREGDLCARMEAERKAASERQALLEDLQAKLQDTFKALSADALKHNNQNFVELAKAHLSTFQEAAKGDLELRQKSIEGLVKPIRESLSQVDARIQDMEKSRQNAYVELCQQVKFLASDQVDLKKETRKLVEALRRPTVRGRWGEMQLRRVVELAGMVGYCDFTEQASVTTADGRLRPDMVVRLPGGKNVVVDAKAPLEAYLNAYEAPDDEARKQNMQSHARQIREHLTKLGQKSYWEHLSPTPEFVVMFLPGEIFFSSALEHDPSLIEEGVEKGVIVASPTTLIALLRAVAYGWRQEKVAESAQQVSELGRELYKRIVTLSEHFSRVGKGLSGAVEAYNKTVSSLESRVLVSARRFKDLAAAPEKELPELEQLEIAPRQVQKGEE